jgi:hypothetical protein
MPQTVSAKKLAGPGKRQKMGFAHHRGVGHIAIQEKKDGKVVDWMEHVRDNQFKK